MGKTARFLPLAVRVACAASVALAACGSPPPPKQVEMVPADSDEATKPSRMTRTSSSGSSSDTPSDDGTPGTGGMTGAGGGGSGGANGKPAANSGGASAGTTASGTMQGTMPQKIGGDTTAKPASSGASAAPAPPTVTAAAGPKVTKAECKRVLDKYVDLAIASDPNLSGLPPDVIKQAFAQAAQQSANPCDGDGVSRNQYKCAMKATTTDAWQACMK